MKRLCLCLVMEVCTIMNLSALDFIASDGLKYTTTSDSEVSLKGATRPAVEYGFFLTIPTTVTHNDTIYTVTSIGDSAFRERRDFTGLLTIPNSITSIGKYAFRHTDFTGPLTLPISLTSIGKGAFYGCSGFTGSLTIPNSVTSIGEYAFYGCSGFTGSLTIPNSVMSIEKNAFWNCKGLTGTLTIPNSVTSIEEGVFCQCGFTGTLTIPNSVTSIGGYAFTHNDFAGLLTIPNSVTSIGERAFYHCRKFTGTLTIPNSVTSIGEAAFCECDGFTDSLIIPSSVKSIGGAAFDWCYSYGPHTIIIKCTTPPTGLNGGCFRYENLNNPLIFVPCGTEEAYKAACGDYDGYIQNFIEEKTNILTLLSDDITKGSVSIKQRNTCDNDEAIIEATPVPSYPYVQRWTFVRWSDGNTDNPRTIVVDKDSSLTAYFQEIGGSDGDEDEGGDEDNNDDGDDDGNGGDDGSGADTPVENVSEDATSTRVWKVLRDGQLLIIRDGEEYSVTGVKIK